MQLLTSPYQYIAADVNNSRNVSILDLIALRKLILSIDVAFANNTSWRFVDAKFQFPSLNPWAVDFPEIININDLQGQIQDADFVAIKIGDLDGNARTSSIAGAEVRNIDATFHFQVEDQALKAGNEYTIAFKARDIADIQGYQGTLTFDAKAVELVDILPGVAGEENFGLRFANEGVITTSWNGEATGNEVIFSLVFRAKADTQLSKTLGVSSRYTVAEAYNQSSELMNVAIQFNTGAVVSAGFELYQNTPNPFKASTVIGFNLPEAAEATITISDVTGKVIRTISNEYAKGRNQITLERSQLPTGVLTYTLKAGKYSATKKMVLIE
ncbi:MAG: T9SS type A sorting domain-containing protein [Saprospiraceae bacterium]|nr:T9SS type A sorting domain-containing protein [Saprospiraceae bacterium]